MSKNALLFNLKNASQTQSVNATHSMCNSSFFLIYDSFDKLACLRTKTSLPRSKYGHQDICKFSFAKNNSLPSLCSSKNKI